MGFGQDGGGGNGHIFGIPFDNAKMRNIFIRFEAVPIDDNMLREKAEPVQSLVHGCYGSIQNIYLIDFLIIHTGYGPG